MDIKRTFFPGDSWLYIKIYCGNVFSNHLLSEILYQILIETYKLHNTKQWFFIRYADPEPHIRLRFQTNEHFTLLQNIVHKLEAYKKDGIIWNVEVATYKREVERYLPENIITCEKIFSNESLMLVNLLRQPMVVKEYMILSISLVGFLINILVEPEGRIDFLSKGFLSFKNEFELDKSQLSKFNSKYKEISKELLNFDLGEYADKKPFLQNFMIEQTRLVKDLLKKEYISDSIVHMFVLRLIHSDNRLMECIIYHHLEKMYKTQAALSKKYVKL